jgi:hypothetical protein
MTISKETLSLVQAAGAAAYAADAALKRTLQDSAEQVRLAMEANPGAADTDALFQTWKTIASLSQSIAQIEAELKTLHAAALNVSAVKTPAHLLRRFSAGSKTAGHGSGPMTVSGKAAKKKAGRSKSAVKRKAAKNPRPLSGNNTQLLAYLERILNKEAFTKVNQSLIATEVGLPKGSISASINKLLSLGLLIESGRSEFKLAPAVS